jgi:hypothetical protein
MPGSGLFQDYMLSLATDSSPDSAGDWLITYDTSGSANKKIHPSALQTSGSSTGGALGVTRYAPSSIQIYSITGTSLADVDSTNLAVTFTAPASGNILVRLCAYADETTNGEFYWGIRESTTNVTGSIGRIIRTTTDAGFVTYSFYLPGISAGSHTYKWSAAVSTGTGRIIMQDGTAGTWAPGLMEVWAAP